MIYLTFGDQPSGVFSSQVIDVCAHIDKTFPVKMKLVCFISIREFNASRHKIRSEYPHAIVLPMFPKLGNWSWNTLTLFFVCLLSGEKSIIARGVLAANLALSMRKAGIIKTVCYDGRGAIAAEWNEYTVTPDAHLKKIIPELEKTAVLDSDFRIAVSSRLVEYWRQNFDFKGNNYVVIPCTVNNDFSPEQPSEETFTAIRKDLGYSRQDMIMVYSGSTAGWQSFKILEQFLVPVLQKDQRNKVLFLSQPDESIDRLRSMFPGQVSDKWVGHKEVGKVLSACDYGILIREKSVTNQVASPTKFAEYLSAGLAVLISENIGDYSDFVEKHGCGSIINGNQPADYSPVTMEAKQKHAKLVLTNFTKEAHRDNYKKLIDSISVYLN